MCFKEIFHSLSKGPSINYVTLEGGVVLISQKTWRYRNTGGVGQIRKSRHGFFNQICDYLRIDHLDYDSIIITIVVTDLVIREIFKFFSKFCKRCPYDFDGLLWCTIWLLKSVLSLKSKTCRPIWTTLWVLVVRTLQIFSMWDSNFLKKYKNVSWRGDDKNKIDKSDGTQQNKNRDVRGGGG